MKRKRTLRPRRRPPLDHRSGFGQRGQTLSRKPKLIPSWTLEAKGEAHCRRCGKQATDLHHIVPRSLSREGREDMRNGLPLCRRCHDYFESGGPLGRDLLTQEELAFVRTIIGPGWLARRYPRDLDERMAA